MPAKEAIFAMLSKYEDQAEPRKASHGQHHHHHHHSHHTPASASPAHATSKVQPNSDGVMVPAPQVLVRFPPRCSTRSSITSCARSSPATAIRRPRRWRTSLYLAISRSVPALSIPDSSSCAGPQVLVHHSPGRNLGVWQVHAGFAAREPVRSMPSRSPLTSPNQHRLHYCN